MFPNLVVDSWTKNLVLKRTIDKFTENGKIWNKKILGNIFHKKNRVEVKLKGIQSSIANDPNKYLLNP